EMNAERLGAPIISSRTKHLIGLLLIFAGLAVFMSQFLIYSGGGILTHLTKTEENNREKGEEQREGRKGSLRLSTDRCEDQGTGWLAWRDACSDPNSHQAGRPRSDRRVEVERRSSLVARRDHMYRRDLQERREDDFREGGLVG